MRKSVKMAKRPCDSSVDSDIPSSSYNSSSEVNNDNLISEGKSSVLLQYRNTPSPKDGLSPAQKLYGHPIQDSLPAHRSSFLQVWQRKAEVAEKQVEATQQSSAKYYNQHAHPLTEIGILSNVAIQTPAQNFGTLMASSQLYHLTGNITLKPPVAEYSKPSLLA